MISDILSYLNARLPNISAVARPLCQLVEETGKDGNLRTFPVVYDGKGNLDYITRFDWRTGMSFWLKNGAEDIELLDRVRANKERVQITIPLKFHWIGTRSTWQNDTQYLEQYILLALQKAITVDNIPSLRASLGLDRIKTVVTNREYGAETLDGVFDNIDLRLPLDMAAAMLEVDLTITGDLNCIVGASCPGIADLLLLESGDFILTETNDFIEL